MRAAAFAVFVLVASPAAAQQICAPLEQLSQVLREDHREVPVAMGDAPRGRIVVFASPDGASWTILIVNPTGVACVAADGVRWRLPGRGA
jgi:hypothetical protein